MPYARCPRFDYAATSLTLTIPQRPWVPRTAAVAGTDTSASGIPAAYLVRRDELMEQRIRFDESEWSSVHALLTAAQLAEVVTVFPDATEPGTSYDCYLDGPKLGEEDIAPTRDAEYGEVYELLVVWRKVSGSVFTDAFYD
jgi:hypothetical protein